MMTISYDGKDTFKVSGRALQPTEFFDWLVAQVGMPIKVNKADPQWISERSTLSEGITEAWSRGKSFKVKYDYT